MNIKFQRNTLALTMSVLICACSTVEEIPDAPYDPRIESVVASALPPPEPQQTPAAGLAMAPGQMMKIHSLNGGAGSCHIVECPGPGNDRIVYDCGTVDATQTSMQEAEIAQFGNGIFNANSNITVIASHPDQDHYIFLDELVGSREVSSVWLGGDVNQYGTTGFVDWLLEKQNQGAPVFHQFPVGYANSGLPVSDISCGLSSVWVLTASIGNTKNSKSIGLLLHYDGFKALFPGDASGDTESSIVANYGALTEDVTLLFGSHHGASSHDSNQGLWPGHTSPDIVVYSSGDKFRHPKCNIVGNYQGDLMQADTHPVWCNPKNNSNSNTTTDTDLAEYVTEVNGVVVVETDGDSLSVTCSKQPAGCF